MRNGFEMTDNFHFQHTSNTSSILIWIHACNSFYAKKCRRRCRLDLRDFWHCDATNTNWNTRSKSKKLLLVFDLIIVSYEADFENKIVVYLQELKYLLHVYEMIYCPSDINIIIIKSLSLIHSSLTPSPKKKTNSFTATLRITRCSIISRACVRPDTIFQ